MTGPRRATLLASVACLAALPWMAASASPGAPPSPARDASAAAPGSTGDALRAFDAHGPQEPGVVAFVGVSVVPMDSERVLEDRTVVVRGERIERLGPADEVDVPQGATVVEGEGRFLIPGLGEMHAHVPSQGGREWMERVLFLYLANGLTTVRGMLGAPEHLELREDLKRGEVVGPRLYTSGPSLNGGSIPTPDSGRRAVRHQVEAGYDFLKIHPGLSRPIYDAIAAEARERGIRWAGHVPSAVGLRHAMEAGQASVDHLDGYMQALAPEGAEPGLEPLFFGVELTGVVEESRMDSLARETRVAGVWNVPTQSLIENILLPGDPEERADRPEMRYVPPEMVREWTEDVRDFQGHPTWEPERARRFVELRRRMIRALQEAEAPLLLGSDAPQVFQVPGFSALQELEILVESGLSPYEALVTGTRNVAAYFGDEAEYGTVAEGKVADLVLLEANPLEDIAAVRERAGVMTRGRWLPAGEIDRRLAEIASDPEP